MLDAEGRIVIELQPKQIELYQRIIDNSDTAFNWIASGGARGGGKSGSIRRIAVQLLFKYPGIRILIFRKISENLQKNHVEPFKREFPEIMQYYRRMDNLITVPVQGLRSQIKFGYGVNMDDIGKFQGDEYDVIFIDEATHITEEMIVELSLTNRSPGLPGFVSKMVLTTNPGNIGHKFIKRVFIDRVYTDDEKLRNRYLYLPARVQDNVLWCKDALIKQGYTVKQYYNEWNEEQRFQFTITYSDYAQRLAALPESKKRAYLYGDWNNFEGQFFEKLSSDIHYIRPFEIPKDWYRNASMDYGNTTCSHILRINDNNTMFCTDEWTFMKGSTTEKKIDYYDWMCKREIQNERFKVIVDTNMDGQEFELDDKVTPMEKFQEYFNQRNSDNEIKFEKIVKSKNPDGRKFRHWCNDEVADSLDWQQDKNGVWIRKPKLYIFQTCPILFQTMGELQTDEDDLEDFDQDQDIDHHFDSLKYNIMSRKRFHSAKDDEEMRSRIQAELNYKKQYNVC